MADIYTKYGYTPDKEAIGRSLEIIAKNIDNVFSPEVLKTCFSLMDLTTLSTTDTEKSVTRLVEKVNT